MKVAVFTVEYTVSEFWPSSIPRELRADCRVPLFHELCDYAKGQEIDLVVLPGGFFRSNFPGGIANALRHHPPNITVLVGCDNVSGSECEVWIVHPNGNIGRKIPEAWKSKGRFCQDTLNRITDRRFQLDNRMYAVYCCGDVLIDDRKAPITYSEAAFVLAHNSASGRQFTRSMRNLERPVFLSQHVKYPYNTDGFAYKGNDDIKPIAKALKGKSKGLKELKWIARIYSI